MLAAEIDAARSQVQPPQAQHAVRGEQAHAEHLGSRGAKRHGELRRTIGGVSQKMLTQTLRTLERDRLVQRTIYPIVPPRVDYALTPLGKTLMPPLSALYRWTERHLKKIQQARRESQKTLRTAEQDRGAG